MMHLKKAGLSLDAETTTIENIDVEAAEMIATSMKARSSMVVVTTTPTGERMTAGAIKRARITIMGRIGVAIEAVLIERITMTVRDMILTELGHTSSPGLQFHNLLGTLWRSTWNGPIFSL